MSSTLLVIIIAVLALLFFVIGMSLTLMLKGRHIDSEISENKNMRKLGLKCAVHDAMEEKREGKECGLPSDCSPGGCASCASESLEKK